METTKEYNIVLLPTDDTEHTKDKICLFGYGLNISGKDDIGYPVHHIYIISDDEVKFNDWLIINDILLKCIGFNELGDIECNNSMCYIKSKCKKVIATTDPSVNYNIHGMSQSNRIPSIQQSFIRIYITAYNEGKPITKVKLETVSFGLKLTLKYEVIIKMPEIKSDEELKQKAREFMASLEFTYTSGQIALMAEFAKECLMNQSPYTNTNESKAIEVIQALLKEADDLMSHCVENKYLDQQDESIEGIKSFNEARDSAIEFLKTK